METFINGVNVYECRFYIPETKPNEDGDEFLDVCNFPNLYHSFCEENKDCWYKQLQRTKKENELLKRRNNILCKEKDFLYSEMQDLRKENEDLNYYIKEYKIVWEIDKKEKYKQALNEIKELAELEVVIFDNKALFSTNIQRIIDKINEVLND